MRGEDHARRAVAALQAVLVPERFLQRMQRAVCREAFDCRHLAAVRLRGERRARPHGAAVHEHGGVQRAADVQMTHRLHVAAVVIHDVEP